jgi:hypothetical protein
VHDIRFHSRERSFKGTGGLVGEIKGGRVNALRALMKDKKERGPDFLRLANALSALYPKNSGKKVFSPFL